jgi:hypothetical protein
MNAFQSLKPWTVSLEGNPSWALTSEADVRFFIPRLLAAIFVAVISSNKDKAKLLRRKVCQGTTARARLCRVETKWNFRRGSIFSTIPVDTCNCDIVSFDRIFLRRPLSAGVTQKTTLPCNLELLFSLDSCAPFAVVPFCLDDDTGEPHWRCASHQRRASGVDLTIATHLAASSTSDVHGSQGVWR